MPPTDVVRTYLQMTAPAQLRPAHLDDPGVRVDTVTACPPSFYRYLYQTVGERWHWRDRAAWSEHQIRAWLTDPAVSLLVLYVEGAPAGYAELMQHPDRTTELVYFGLLPEFVARGLGKYLLTAAVERAWATGTPRVWLHTCTLDSPHALPNYLARGFTPYQEERYTVEL